MGQRRVRFDGGTLVVEGFDPSELPPGFAFDPRIGFPRGPASAYAALVLPLHKARVRWDDEARAYPDLGRTWHTAREPRPFQSEALAAWRAAGRRGVVVLPTGAGKSHVAEMAIADAGRAALVVAPTLDLVGQWWSQLRRAFGDPVGVVGGGTHDVRALTVTTYDSAWMQMPRLGNLFGLLIFDEVHHLPGPAYATAAEMSIAPFRLGLTATLERPDGGHSRVDTLVGPVVYRKEIGDLAGEFLAEYRTEVLTLPLTAEERAAYEAARACFRGFVESRGIRLGGQGFQQFLREASRSAEGRAALVAWRDSRRIAFAATEKLRALAEILDRHRNDRVIVFTADNATVYEVSRRFLVPAITHRTEVRERRRILEAFASGELPVVATSRVLNEGVDVPSAAVAVVLSGSATVREHVQRLGRILRRSEGKQAVLYELVAAESAEEATSRRRREHDAWRS
jgi:superfamily II DNA or RNA helicase